jgi:hypothetical protein
MSELSQTLILGHYQDFLRGKEPRSCFPIARPALNFTSGQQHGEHPLELAVEMNLEAEAASIRSTGIGCYFDDPVHEVFGISSRDWQSFYHFTVGGAVEDKRLTTLPAS